MQTTNQKRKQATEVEKERKRQEGKKSKLSIFFFFICKYNSCWLFLISLAFLCLFSLASAFVGVGHIAPDEERSILSKQVVQVSFTYGE